MIHTGGSKINILEFSQSANWETFGQYNILWQKSNSDSGIVLTIYNGEIVWHLHCEGKRYVFGVVSDGHIVAAVRVGCLVTPLCRL